MSIIERYFSQNGEDFLLNAFFDGKSDGIFIDVGAFDGVHLSNSYCFELKGWTGICVEPQQFYFGLCESNRPGSTCVHAACIESGGPEHITISTDQTGLFSGRTINTDAKNISAHYADIGIEIAEPDQEEVPAVALSKLIDERLPEDCQIDFISIDVEGFELEVLQGLDFKKHAPQVLVVEANEPELSDSLRNHLQDFGFIAARTVGPNTFFVSNKDDAEKLRNIEITCTIEKQMHPLGASFTQAAFLNGKVLYRGENAYVLLRQLEATRERVEDLRVKVKNLQGVIDHIKEERNAKVADLLEKLEQTRAERNEKVQYLLGLIHQIKGSK